MTNKPNRLVLAVDRDGWTNGLQLQIASLDENGHGSGYRLAGSKYNGSGKRLLEEELNERDVAEIRKFLDEAYPESDAAPRTERELATLAVRAGHALDEGHAPLLPEREAEIRQGQPGDWLPGPWTIRDIDGTADEPGRWELVHHGSGKVLATLPDWAGNVALWAADVHDAVPELLDELDRVRAERDRYAAELDRLNLEHWEDQQSGAVLAEVQAERRRQDEKWGEQNHPDVDPRDIPYVTHGYYASRADIWRQVNEERATPSRSLGRCTGHPEGPHTHTAWDGVLLEEAYEALAEEDPARLRAELIQVAAVAAAWIEAIDRRAAARTNFTV